MTNYALYALIGTLLLLVLLLLLALSVSRAKVKELQTEVAALKVRNHKQTLQIIELASRRSASSRTASRESSSKASSKRERSSSDDRSRRDNGMGAAGLAIGTALGTGTSIF